jgi:WD40 repeat protein
VAVGGNSGILSLYDSSSSLSKFSSVQAHSDGINRIKQSPFNSTTIYVATCSHDFTVKVWMVYSMSSSWTLLRTYVYPTALSYVYALEWYDADTLASSQYKDRTINIWSVSTGGTKRTITTNGEVTCLKLFSYSSSLSYLAAGLGAPGPYDINIYNINTGSMPGMLRGHSDWVTDLAQLNADTMASASYDTTVKIWNMTTFSLKFTLQGNNGIVNVLKQITSTIVASGHWYGQIKLWNFTNGQLIRNLTGHYSVIFWSLDLMDNGQTLISGAYDYTIRKWNWKTGELLSTNITSPEATKSLAIINLGESHIFVVRV